MKDSTLYGQTNVPIEFSLTGEHSYENAFDQVEVDVEVVGPDGGPLTVPAFWAGGNVFRVRFAAGEPGRYTYRSICTNPDDCGLHDRRGEFEMRRYEGPCELYRHGRLRVAASKRTLEHVDGKPFFWLGDTWWMGFTSRLNWPDGFARLVADRVSKGFNLIQIVAGPLPDLDAAIATWHRDQTNEAGWPWEKDWGRLNPGFYDMADLRIAYLVEKGLVPCIVGMWGYYLPYIGVEKAKQHWRNLVARYGAYPVLWCIAGETTMPTYSVKDLQNDVTSQTRARQKEGWTEVMRYVGELDGHRNLISTHPSVDYGSRSMISDETLVDLDMLQTGHAGDMSFGPTVELVNSSVARRPRMPVVNSEVCYEGIRGGSWQDAQRFFFWTAMTSGAGGYTYGAQGIWQMNSQDDPFIGTTTSCGDRSWQEAMHLPGSGQVGLGRLFFERYPWWLFEPRHEPAAEEAECVCAFATGIAGAVAVFYIGSENVLRKLRGMENAYIQVEPGAKYRAFYFNPRTGEQVRSYQIRGAKQVALGEVRPDEDGRWVVPAKPTMEDWVLVLEDADALAKIGGMDRRERLA